MSDSQSLTMTVEAQELSLDMIGGPVTREQWKAAVADILERMADDNSHQLEGAKWKAEIDIKITIAKTRNEGYLRVATKLKYKVPGFCSAEQTAYVAPGSRRLVVQNPKQTNLKFDVQAIEGEQ